MSTAATTRRGEGRAARESYLLRLTPEQADDLYSAAHEQNVTVRALLLHRTLGIPLDDPDVDNLPRRQRRASKNQESLPMTA